MASSRFRYSDRADAGRQLAARLATMKLDRPVVYALPRGGVPVGVEIARVLHAPLDLVLVRKIGSPGQPELALGAVVEGNPPQTVVNEDVRRETGADEAYLLRARQRELAELQRRRVLYLGDRPRLDPAGRTAIIVDDGLATGATAKAALIALKRRGAARIVLAIPAAPEETLADMRQYADHVVCLQSAWHFAGVGGFYDDFHQLTDIETVGLLRRFWAECGEDPPGSDDASGRRQSAAPPIGLAGAIRAFFCTSKARGFRPPALAAARCFDATRLYDPRPGFSSRLYRSRAPSAVLRTLLARAITSLAK